MEEHESKPGPGVDQDDLKARLKALEEEAARLRASMEATPAVEPTPEPEAAEEEVLDLTPAAPAQMQEAERLLAAARVAKMRNQKSEAERLVQQAKEAAPTSPLVLELVADELRERGQLLKAVAAYKDALRYDPENIGLQRKHAEVVLKSDTVASAMMHMRSEDSFESVASAKTATILSVLLPGLGQIVSGHFAKGAFYLIGWIIGIVGVILSPGGIGGLLKAATGATSEFNPIVMVPLLIAVGCHLLAIFDAASRAKGSTKRRIDRPVPPANLPFE